MKERKPSPAQIDFLLRAVRNDGKLSTDTLFGHSAAVLRSAWHRTAAALERKGFVVITRHGWEYTATITEAGREIVRRGGE